MRLLIIEDDTEIIDMLSGFLESEAFEVVTACDGDAFQAISFSVCPWGRIKRRNIESCHYVKSKQFSDSFPELSAFFTL